MEKDMNPAPESHVVGILRAALEEIVNPVAAMRQRADAEGGKLDGMMANMLARDPEYLRGIARAALASEASE